jgi:hypothetical protein
MARKARSLRRDKQRSRGTEDALRDVIPKMGYKCHTLECRKCHRKILVEVGLFGVDHTGVISVICADCLRQNGLSPSFRRKFRSEAEEIEKWMAS